MSGDNAYSELSIWELFRSEADDKCALLTSGLLALERGGPLAEPLEELMRAAHSLKGAAAMVESRAAIEVAHAMEDVFVGLQKSGTGPNTLLLDLLLDGVQLMRQIADTPESDKGASLASTAAEFVTRITSSESADAGTGAANIPTTPVPRAAAVRDDQNVRVTADRLNRLLALAGESLVAGRGVEEFVRSLGRARKLTREDMATLDEAQRRAARVATTIYREVVDLRMRPFSESVTHLHVMVRTLARELNKDVQLEIQGATTPVDREIMERMDPPIVNLIRNAVDHGIDSAEERLQRGKPAVGRIQLSAAHRAGMLFIVIEDDGRGVDVEVLRQKVVARQLTTAEVAARLSQAELMDFLFLPGFSLRDQVTEISGRGVGLDIVQATVRELGGKVAVTTALNSGLRFEFQLPLTLSVLRALLVEIGGEPYAMPIARIGRVLKIRPEDIETVEGRQHIDVDGDRIGLVSANQVLAVDAQPGADGGVPVVVLGHGTHRYALAVERLLGETELVVRPLDPLLGKVKNISSAALLPDNTSVLILDVEDLVLSIDSLVTGGRVQDATAAPAQGPAKRVKRILVVDDSFTVRELERKLLSSHGYAVDIAVDGIDGWNALRATQYDLVVTDVDMPRMDGITLTKKIREDPKLHLLPVMIVSYKEREEDRIKGLEAGADQYLTKSSYHDESMINAIRELIGVAVEK